MHKLKLQKVLEELGRDTYDISLRLGEELTIRVRQDSLSEFPKNGLEVEHSGKNYSVPIFIVGSPLKVSYDSLEKACNGDLEVLVGTTREVRKQLGEGIQTNKIYVIYDSRDSLLYEEEKAEIKQKAVRYTKEISQIQINGRNACLQSLCDSLDPELRGLVKDSLNAAAKEDRKLVAEYDKRNEKIEQMGRFIDISAEQNLVGKIFNKISFGRFGNILSKEIDQYAERNVAWRTLEQVADQMYRMLEDDATSLVDRGNSELSERLREVALFYGNLSSQAMYGRARMNNLLRRAVSLYVPMVKLKAPDVDGISSAILKKISGSYVSFQEALR